MKKQKKINIIKTLENLKAMIESQKQPDNNVDNYIEALNQAIIMIKSYDEFLKQMDKSSLQENKELSIFSSDSNLELKGKWFFFE